LHPLVLVSLVQAVFILGLSWASGYAIEFPDSNWDTTLFLTPYGILHNFLTDSTLAQFYSELSRGQGFSGSGPWWSYAYIFAQSCALEMPVYLVFGVRKPLWQGALFIFVMNSVTHPIVFFGLMNLPLTFVQTILIAEAFAIVTETAVLCRLAPVSFTRAFAASVLANFVSWQFAPMLTYFVWG